MDDVINNAPDPQEVNWWRKRRDDWISQQKQSWTSADLEQTVDASRERDYRALGLNQGATRQEVQEAYKDLVRLIHPDVHRDKTERVQKKAHEQFIVVDSAYKRLMAALPDPGREAPEAKPPPGYRAIYESTKDPTTGVWTDKVRYERIG
ncbi:MAG: J domain-containing protein [Chloroflexota bacterium]